MKRILLTGARGFLGSWFRRFSTVMSGYEVVCGTTTPGDSDCRLFECEYADVSKIGPVDIILHFASVIPVSFEAATYEACYFKNMTMMENLTRFALREGVGKFVYLSSYGSMRDPSRTDIRDYYTLSKVCGEKFVDMMSARGVEAASLRISAPYGEYSRSRSVIRIFAERALAGETLKVFGSGRREQNFTYAGDIVQAVEKCLIRTIGGVYDIVSERNTSMLELAELIRTLTGSKSAIEVGGRPDPQEDYRPAYDYARAADELNYSPRYDIKTGLERYLAWMERSQ